MKKTVALLLLTLLVVGCGKREQAENQQSSHSMAKELTEVEKIWRKEFVETKTKAEAGDADAQYSLGYKYEKSIGVEKDEKKAVRWYREAAAQDHLAALFAVGLMYAYGKGVKRDDKESVRWVRKAAEKNFAKAQHRLGYNYEKGVGVKKSEQEAVKWYRKAVEQGFGPAEASLNKLLDQ